MKYLAVIVLALCIIVLLESTLVNGQGGQGGQGGKGKIGGGGSIIRRIRGKWTKDEWRGDDGAGNKLYRRRVKGRSGKYGCQDENGSSSFATSDGKSDSFSNECFD